MAQSIGGMLTPPPQRPPDLMNPPTGPTGENLGGKLKDFMQSPTGKAMLLQAAVSLASGQSGQRSLAEALAAGGRAGDQQYQQDMAQWKLAQQQQQQSAVSAARGSGSSSAAASKVSADRLKRFDNYYKGFQKEISAASDAGVDPPMSDRQAQGMAWLLAMRDTGMPEPLQNYYAISGMKGDPGKIAAAQSQYLDNFALGPEAGLKATIAMGDPKNRPPATPAAAAPAAPVSAPPAAAPVAPHPTAPPAPAMAPAPPQGAAPVGQNGAGSNVPYVPPQAPPGNVPAPPTGPLAHGGVPFNGWGASGPPGPGQIAQYDMLYKNMIARDPGAANDPNLRLRIAGAVGLTPDQLTAAGR